MKMGVKRNGLAFMNMLEKIIILVLNMELI